MKHNKITNIEEREDKILFYEHDVEPIKDPNNEKEEISHIKCKKRSEDFEFTYYSKKQYDEYKKELKEFEDIEPEELGFFKLTKKFKNKGDNILEIKNNKFDVKDKKKNPFRGIKGYVKVSEDKYSATSERYIALTKIRIIPIILILLLLIGFVFGFVSCDSPYNPFPNFPNFDFEQGEDWDGKLPGEGEGSQGDMEYIEIPGYGELTVNDKESIIYLINPTGNTVFMKYEIYNGEKLVHSTNLIPSGKMVQWDVKSDLTKGEYSLIFKISTYDAETKATCNGATQKVALTVN